MNMKEMMVSIITAMVVVAMFAVMISPASSQPVPSLMVYKSSDKATYYIGETIYYNVSVKNVHTYTCNNIQVTDTLPNGTQTTLATGLSLAPGVMSPTYHTSYVVDAGDLTDDGTVINSVTASGTYASNPTESASGTATKTNVIITEVTFDFNFEATGCMKVKFTGSSTGSVKWHRWNFGDGHQSPVINGAPNAGNAVTHTYTSCGDKTVRLYGESITGDSNDTVQTVHVACKPIVHVGVNPGCVVNPGDSATFSVTSLTNDTPIDTYEWTFTKGVSGSGVHTWPADGNVSITRAIPASGTTATLKVTDDLGCEGTGKIPVGVCTEKPPSEVPILTPAGMLALIGLLGIVGGSRILRRGRRS